MILRRVQIITGKRCLRNLPTHVGFALRFVGIDSNTSFVHMYWHVKHANLLPHDATRSTVPGLRATDYAQGMELRCASPQSSSSSPHASPQPAPATIARRRPALRYPRRRRQRPQPRRHPTLRRRPTRRPRPKRQLHPPQRHPTTTGFPPRCTALVANADVDALAAQHLRLTADGVSATSAGTSQLVCRFQGSGEGGDTAIIIVASGYADPPTASAEDGILRTAAEGQGGKFTRLDGVADEAYSFTYPTVTGVIARNGSRSVSIGVGKLLGVPTPAEFNTLLQLLLAKLGD